MFKTIFVAFTTLLLSACSSLCTGCIVLTPEQQDNFVLQTQTLAQEAFEAGAEAASQAVANNSKLCRINIGMPYDNR